MGNPCDDMDYALFYASTIITIGNGVHMPFGKPKDIAPQLTRLIQEKVGRFGKPWRTMLGFPRSKWRQASISRTFMNSWALGHFAGLPPRWAKDDIVW